MVKKDVIKILIIIAIIFGIIIYSLISLKKDTEEISYTNRINATLSKIEEEISSINSLKTMDTLRDYLESIITTKNEKDKIKVYVTGAVNTPGVVELEEDSRIEDAIELAGGITSEAILDNVNLAYVLQDGQKLNIPKSYDAEEYLTIENGIGVIEEETEREKVNINTDNVDELMKLPGVGESLAKKIIDYKNQNGKFKNIEDLKNVSGIGDKKFESLKEYLVLK